MASRLPIAYLGIEARQSRYTSAAVGSGTFKAHTKKAPLERGLDLDRACGAFDCVNPLHAMEEFVTMAQDLSPEFHAWHSKVRAEEAQRIGPLLDARLLEAQNLRLVEGHKARERTLRSLDMDHAPQHPSQAAE